MSAAKIQQLPLILRKLDASDAGLFAQAWDWMQQRPDLYGENEGFANFTEFCQPPDVLQYFGMFEGDALIGLASLRLEGKKSCRAGLIAPENPRFRQIVSLMLELQRQFFEDFGGEALWICVPSGSHEVAQKLVGWFGWKPISPGLFTFTVFDHLNSYEYEGNAKNSTASH